MGPQRYLIKVVSEAALPSLLLRRHPEDTRIIDADLQQPHDLQLQPGRSDIDELARRTFSDAEALAACQEWHRTREQLDVVVRQHTAMLVITPWERTALPAAPMRLLPLIGESGLPIELKHSVPAWASSRWGARAAAASRIFHRAAEQARPYIPCAEVGAVWCPSGQPPRRVSARLVPGRWSATACERFPFYDLNWLESHYTGFSLLSAARALLTPMQAYRVADALQDAADCVDVHVPIAGINRWLASAEFSAGPTRAVRRVHADPALSAAAGADLCWVVWPDDVV